MTVVRSAWHWGPCCLALGMIAVTSGVFFASGSGGSTREIGPSADWCAEANGLAPGEELLLAPGDYDGSCTLRGGGRPGAPIVIRAADAEAPPRLVFLGSTDNVVNVAASFVTLRGLQLGPSLPNVDAIRIRGGDDVTVENCVFSDLGGIAVVSNSTIQRLTVRNNEIQRSSATAMYLGCHDGAGCRVTDALVEGNYINGVDAPHPQTGYGVQVKLNSTAVIRDNVIVHTKGPGIMVYGAHHAGLTSVVERNLVVRARTEAGIVIGGGPVAVHNNIVVGGARGGIALEDYGRRGLLRGIVVANNTVYSGLKGGITIPATGRLEARLLYNAAHTLTGPAFPALPPGVIARGNIDCRSVPCFVDPLALNFGPVPGSALVGRAPQQPGVPPDDYFGSSRPQLGAAGAVEAGTEQQVRLGRKPLRK